MGSLSRSRESGGHRVTRCMQPSELIKSNLWWKGPYWLCKPVSLWPSTPAGEISQNEESLKEMRKGFVHDDLSALVATSENIYLDTILPVCKTNDIGKFLTVTASVLRFCKNLKIKAKLIEQNEICVDMLLPSEIANAENFWLVEVQKDLKSSVKNYSDLEKQLGLFCDSKGIIRCRGKFAYANLPYEKRYPALYLQN